MAEESGVGKAITAPRENGFFKGVSVAFRTGAKNSTFSVLARITEEMALIRENHPSYVVLEKEAIIGSEVALHIALGHYKGSQEPSISTEIAQLRQLLLKGLAESSFSSSSTADYFARVVKGELPLVIEVDKEDTIASLILLKREIEARAQTQTHSEMRWIL